MVIVGRLFEYASGSNQDGKFGSDQRFSNPRLHRK